MPEAYRVLWGALSTPDLFTRQPQASVRGDNDVEIDSTCPADGGGRRRREGGDRLPAVGSE